MASNGNVSHAQMWDDSVLVDSWNDALEEYKQYHSIQARGENAQEVLKAHEKLSNGLGGEVDSEALQVGEQDEQDHQAKENISGEKVDHDTISQGGGSQGKDKQFTADEVPGALEGGPKKGGPLPAHLIGQVHDDNLKNLLMSWYYAGYYTGLYEGQQQGIQAQDRHEN
ncbi:Survival motor neuron-like protein [Lachnellula suecica]|uniref:Survival motor neuron-like protein n=1 Tax=Lachnellula suecica TaxID=602035 RepID=A0A8T9CAM4_9HELO|nr:Survival motor neuron-like protein [Lachnellula suecica]